MAGKSKGRQKVPPGDRYRRILDAATDIFAEKGYFGTSMKEVAESAGMPVAHIYRHFTDKNELFLSVLHESLGGMRKWADLTGPANRSDDAGVFRAYVEHLLDANLEDRRRVRLGLYLALEGEHIGIFDEPLTEPLPGGMDMLGHYIQKRMDAGAFREGDANLVARLLTAATYTYAASEAVALLGRPLATDGGKLVDTIVEVFLNGVRKK